MQVGVYNFLTSRFGMSTKTYVLFLGSARFSEETNARGRSQRVELLCLISQETMPFVVNSTR